jgi:hypothetical protein
LPAPGNRDLSVRLQRQESDGARVDPTPLQLQQLLCGEMPKVELSGQGIASQEATSPAVAELDWQLLLTQLVLATALGIFSGFIVFESVDGIAGVASVFFVVAIFRSSMLGALAGGIAGWFVAKRLDPTDRLLPLFVPWFGVFLGSFLGNFWRRYCPFVVKKADRPRSIALRDDEPMARAVDDEAGMTRK